MPFLRVNYDIGCSAKRGKVAAKLEKVGSRLQRSVFHVECGEGALKKLERELQELLEENDSLLILPLCERCFEQGLFIGKAPPTLIIA